MATVWTRRLTSIFFPQVYQTGWTANGASDPLPTRTTCGSAFVRSITVEGSTPQGPPSTMTSSALSRRARFSSASPGGASPPPTVSVAESIGASSSASSACAAGWPGMRTPIVLRLVARRGPRRRARRVEGELPGGRARRAPRHLAAGRQDEGVASGRRALQQAKARVVHGGIGRDLGEVAAHERETVPLVHAANPAQPLERGGGAEVATERVARIGGIGDQAAPLHGLGREADQPLLRMRRMDREKLGHSARKSSISRATSSG